MDKKRSFGIVEILLVLVVLTTISIVAIPATLKCINNIKKEDFAKNVNEIVETIKKKYEDKENKTSKIYVYDIKDDANTKYEGYIVVDARESEVQYYLFIHNDDYQIMNRYITGIKMTSRDLVYYNKNSWINIQNTYQACRSVESDLSYDCLNKDGYIIAQ